MPEVERFGWVLGADGEHGGIDRREDGGFVRYSDYEKARQQGAEEERERLLAWLRSDKRERLTEEAVGIAGLPKKEIEWPTVPDNIAGTDAAKPWIEGRDAAVRAWARAANAAPSEPREEKS